MKNLLYLLLFINHILCQGRRFGHNSSNHYNDQRRLITDSRPFSFGYPTQIILETKVGLDYLKEKKNNLKILYYAYLVPHSRAGNPPSQRYLLASINLRNKKKYIGIKFKLNSWPRFAIITQFARLYDNIQEAKDDLEIDFLNPSFFSFYKHAHKYLLEDEEFELFINEQKKKGM